MEIDDFSELRPQRPVIAIIFAIGIVIAVVIAGIAGVNTYLASKVTEQAAPVQEEFPDAMTVAADYLTALVERDAAAAEKLRASTFEPVVDGYLVGDAAVAELLDLVVNTEVIGVTEMAPDDYGRYNGEPDPERTDRAVVTYRVNYSLVAEGKAVQASNIQALQLHRKSVNAAGDIVDRPIPASEGPFTFGPWLIDSFEWRGDDGGLTTERQYTSTYVPEIIDSEACWIPSIQFVTHSLHRYEGNSLDLGCYAGEGELVAGDPAVIDYILSDLKPLTDDDVVNLIGSNQTSPFEANPLAEIEFPIGDRTFVATYLTADPIQVRFDRPQMRIIALTER